MKNEKWTMKSFGSFQFPKGIENLNHCSFYIFNYSLMFSLEM